MSVSVKCRTGKCEKFFSKLNPGDIDFFECDDCPPEKSESESIESKEKSSQEPEISEETPAQKKLRLKAEKRAK